jgi:hypothetical protein
MHKMTRGNDAGRLRLPYAAPVEVAVSPSSYERHVVVSGRRIYFPRVFNAKQWHAGKAANAPRAISSNFHDTNVVAYNSGSIGNGRHGGLQEFWVGKTPHICGV